MESLASAFSPWGRLLYSIWCGVAVARSGMGSARGVGKTGGAAAALLKGNLKNLLWLVILRYISSTRFGDSVIGDLDRFYKLSRYHLKQGVACFFTALPVCDRWLFPAKRKEMLRQQG